METPLKLLTTSHLTRGRALVAGLLVAAFLLPLDSAASVGTPLYPDLKTLKPNDLSLSRAPGTGNYIVRFSNTVLNDGEGPLELEGRHNADTGITEAFQHLFDSEGQMVGDPVRVGEFEFHPAHNHWHFGEFARYEVWTRKGWEKRQSDSGDQAAPLAVSSKVSFCIIDSINYGQGRGPDQPRYRATVGPGGYRQCGQNGLQGLSVGWADIYSSSLAEQWVDLGPERPRNKNYVLRSVVDPANILFESDGKTDEGREGAEDNASVVKFRITKRGVKLGWQ